MSYGSEEDRSELSASEEYEDIPPVVMKLSFAGQVYHGDSSVHSGFERRLRGTLFGSLLKDDAEPKEGEDDVITLQADFLPDAVLDLFPDIWNYLQTGMWKTEITTLAAKIRWQEAIAWVGIEHPRGSVERTGIDAIIVNKQLLQLPERKVARSFCVELEEMACIKSDVPCTFDDESIEGARILRSRLGSVKINPELGSLSLKLPGNIDFDVITRHTLLKDKLMTALILRETKSQFRVYDIGMLLILQVDVMKNLKFGSDLKRRVEPFVEWPAFWFVVCLRRVDHWIDSTRESRFVKVHTEVLPGGLRTLTDGSVILLSNPDSLRKALLSIFWAKEGVIQMPALKVNPIAPQGPVKAVHTGHYSKNKGKGNCLAGKSMSHLWGPHCWLASRRFPTVRTLDPQGRAPQSIWIVKRGQQLVLLIHAADGRVALGQVEGPHGTVPSRWPVHENKPYCSGKVARWDVWCRHDNDAPVGSWKRLSLRNQFAVPICHMVLAVLPRQDEVLILQKTHPQDKPKFWRAEIPHDSSLPSAFVTIGHIGDSWRRMGSWPDHNWFSYCAMEFSEMRQLPAVCEVLFGTDRQPEFEFQRWSVANAEVVIRSHHLYQPVIGPGYGWYRKGGKNDRVPRRRGKCRIEAPPPSPEGYCIDHWKTIARIE